MATSQQRNDLLAVLCWCQPDDQTPHTLGEAYLCTVQIKPGNYGSWKPVSDHRGKTPRYPVADIFAELARNTPDRAERQRLQQSAATVRHASKWLA